MREIKFRGKRHNGEWVYGSLVYSNNIDTAIHYEIDEVRRFDWCYVDSDTIGQFTGLTDKNGKEIYEGDILEVEGMYAKVVWNKEKASFEYEYLHPTQIANTFYEFNMPYLSIVGNIHDNKELLKY